MVGVLRLEITLTTGIIGYISHINNKRISIYIVCTIKASS